MYLASVNPVFLVINIVLIIIIILMVGSPVYYWFRGRQINGAIDGETFEKGRTHAQIIDLRERKTFDSKHILGARNIPFAALKQDMGSLRKDLPVYLYEDGTTLAIKAAMQLRKKGFKDIHWLKGGMKDWSGKIKGANA
ncbi:rhodanese-like domain-containing protein [Schleiferilactobacillus perolens]|jgi:rhodanese-related sulfurtransferase|uniref:Rhodanese domain-containing protein n=1 Tax=Schleiferilactobacillus perolens DSM 12744 TaxID=1423792 RepID=A0A0R1MXP5_9LACO|nr:rhodanese-like domain-containing protein [Schleiferilactobacillus perolens]KRL12911.1 hypothetical protein FD09_GL002450 [Schleiferilactobacillus perolens DSM 12744]MCI1892100.1 rhodanese-like domain-containing protein [Schleiferilactobacillus harbinensis]MCI1913979.1 rhodanese-like domain-containing protein [Schleiferilactobacillus harbinensis]MCI2171875.1 rhodanese-like domain-containing protein [Schleiferilactobacillus perolens]